MSLSIQELRTNYSRLSTEQLTRIAMEEAGGLSPEGAEALRQEMAARNLGDQTDRAYQAQAVPMTQQRLDGYCALLRQLSCPVCGMNTKPLNGTLVSTTVSFILVSQRTKRPFIACPDCLDGEIKAATNKTLLLGWWGFPWGIFYSIGSIDSNSTMKRNHHMSEPSPILKSFVLERVGRIAAVENDPHALVAYLKEENATRQ